MNITGTQEDNRILPALALALVDNPRATLQELAKAVGISKATLYRFCRTREQLIERLSSHSAEVFNQVLGLSDLQNGPPLEGLNRLITNNMEHRELTVFLMHYWWKTDSTNVDVDAETSWQVALDAFFLRGQQQGVFRIDIPAPALTEIWSAVMVGLVDAERRGRVARAGLSGLIETAFLLGALSQ